MSSLPTLQSLLQSPYFKNFFLLFPFLFLGGLILFLLNRADSLRAGAGLRPPPQLVQPPAPAPALNDVNTDVAPEIRETGGEGEQEEVEEEVDVNEFLAEAGGVAGDDDFDEDGDDNEPGPANAAGAAVPRAPRNRGIVGKKKARNLEQRDRRRAYNEFLQSQARDRREREKALEDDLQEAIFSEKQRRALAEIKIEKQKLREKEERREAEEKNAKYVTALKTCIKEIVEGDGGCGKISLRALGHKVGKDDNWVRKTIVEEKLLGVDNASSADTVSVITETGWLVRIGREEIATVARRLDEVGKLSWEDLSIELESSLKRL
ncbi:hypothetical protein ABW20_dc0109838 [Dactylellina cionopaga]|nr:hypothetical protein ABW20_dc0109838 [Dactylellina cionopaga]